MKKLMNKILVRKKPSVFVPLKQEFEMIVRDLKVDTNDGTQDSIESILQQFNHLIKRLERN